MFARVPWEVLWLGLSVHPVHCALMQAWGTPCLLIPHAEQMLTPISCIASTKAPQGLSRIRRGIGRLIIY